jgi:Tol biopolymer transport system component/DNA-binding winged helix-turn-helix (wHTH) protein
MEPAKQVVYEFGPFSFDPGECLLVREGRIVHLPPKALDTLRVLVENAGKLVEKDDLIRAVWPDTFVEEGALVQNIFRLRKTLDSETGQASLIETVPKRGYRFTGAIRHAAIARPAARKPRRVVAYAAACAAGLLAFAILWTARSPAGTVPPSALGFRKLTNNGQATIAAIAPDGSRVVYASDSEGANTLWMGGTQAGSQAKRIATASPRFRGLSFSSDGKWIEITADNALDRVSTAGGQIEQSIHDVDEPPAFSPDGASVAFVREDLGKGDSAVVRRGNDGAEKVLSVRRLPLYYGAASWRGDGAAIAFAAGKVGGSRDMTVVEIPAAGGAERRITSQAWQSIEGVAWLPGDRGLLVSAIAEPFGRAQIWHIAYPSGSVTRVTNDVLNYRGVTVSKDGQVTTVAGGSVSSLHAVRLAAGERRDVVRIPSRGESESRPAWLRDGRLVYESSIGDRPDIWIMNPDGTNRVQLTRNQCSNTAPAVSGGGRFVVYVAHCDSGAGIWRVNSDGSGAALVAAGREVNSPAGSPDGKWVVFESDDAGKATVWRVPIEGGEPQPLSDKLSRLPVISPDGTQVAMYYWSERDDAPRQIVTIPLAGGSIHVVAPVEGEIKQIAWAHDGTSLLLLRHSVHTDIWRQPVDGRPATRLTDFADDETRSFALAPDGRTLVCARDARWADVVMFRMSPRR